MYGKSLSDFPERLEGFIQVLASVPLAAMDAGFAACMNTCVEFPVPVDVLIEAEKWQRQNIELQASQKLLGRTTGADSADDAIDPERIPKGWTLEEVVEARRVMRIARGGARRPLHHDEDPEFLSIEALGSKSGVSKAEIAQWLEEGKAKARARYSALAKDPRWREQQTAAGVPEYRRQAEAAMAQRNGPSTVPADPAARKSWAREKAVSMGWVPQQSREAGDELK